MAKAVDITEDLQNTCLINDEFARQIMDFRSDYSDERKKALKKRMAQIKSQTKHVRVRKIK